MFKKIRKLVELEIKKKSAIFNSSTTQQIPLSVVTSAAASVVAFVGLRLLIHHIKNRISKIGEWVLPVN